MNRLLQPARFVLAWRLHVRRTVYFASGSPITFTPLYDQAKVMDEYSAVAWREFLHERGHKVAVLPYVAQPAPAPPVRVAQPSWFTKFAAKIRRLLTVEVVRSSSSNLNEKETL